MLFFFFFVPDIKSGGLKYIFISLTINHIDLQIEREEQLGCIVKFKYYPAESYFHFDFQSSFCV